MELPINLTYSVNGVEYNNKEFTLAPHEQTDLNYTEFFPIERESNVTASIKYSNPFTRISVTETKVLTITIPIYYQILRYLTFILLGITIVVCCYLGYRRLTTEEYEGEVDVEGL